MKLIALYTRIDTSDGRGIELTTLTTVDVPYQVFECRDWDKVAEKKYCYFWRYPNFREMQCRIGQGSLLVKNQLGLSGRFDNSDL